jgi:hypothetical protein
MSNAADGRLGVPHGTSLLPRDLSADELTAAPTLATADVLLIEDLTDAEDEAFAAALRS